MPQQLVVPSNLNMAGKKPEASNHTKVEKCAINLFGWGLLGINGNLLTHGSEDDDV
jgi:hypothetical protein